MQRRELEFTYNVNNQQPFGYGFARCDTYDICICLNDPMLAGGELNSMRVPLPVVEGCKVNPQGAVWVSATLPDGEISAANCVGYKNVSITGDKVECVFDKGIMIPADGLYIGYTITVDEIASGVRTFPIAVVNGNSEGSLYYRTAQNSRWDKTYSRMDYMSAMTVTLDMDIPQSAVSIEIPSGFRAKAGDETEMEVRCKNRGVNPLKSIKYQITTGGKNSTGELKFTGEGEYGTVSPAMVKFTAPEELGDAGLEIKVLEVNGIVNDGVSPTVQMDYRVLPVIPKYRPLVEEYTGLWCGNCPAGWVALEEAIDTYGDDFVYITYHINDILTSYATLPANPKSVPAVGVNRYSLGSFADIPNMLPDFVNNPTDVDLRVNITWTDESKSAIKATADVTFMEEPEEGRFETELILVCDKLSDPTWAQTNYFIGDTSRTGKYWDIFTKGSAYVFGLDYNSVAALNYKASQLVGSIPQMPEVFETYKISGNFNLADGKSAKGVQLTGNKENIRVIAVLMDTFAGTMLNSASSPLSRYCTTESDINGVESVKGETEVVKIVNYDLAGKQLTVEPHGIPYIQVKTYADGSIASEKRCNL
ncbi:MAG: hypothetical protein K2H35_01560 [Muribaculaceae bacterium]|nr:hypothetical protein [Muribaculaceae bacterium]